MNIVTLDPKTSKEEQRKQDLLEVLDEMRKQVKAGKIREFVACSIDVDSECQIHVSAQDLPGAIGLFEIGKHLLVQSEAME